jgi:phage gp46-like protein
MARGGFREGAGRPAGSTNKSSPEQSQRLSELAKTYTEEALQTLVDVARNGRTDAARVSAANALLERAYGKPAVNQEQEIVDLPPVVIELVSPST